MHCKPQCAQYALGSGSLIVLLMSCKAEAFLETYAVSWEGCRPKLFHGEAHFPRQALSEHVPSPQRDANLAASQSRSRERQPCCAAPARLVPLSAGAPPAAATAPPAPRLSLALQQAPLALAHRLLMGTPGRCWPCLAPQLSPASAQRLRHGMACHSSSVRIGMHASQ